MTDEQKGHAPVDLFRQAVVHAAAMESVPPDVASELRLAAAFRLFASVEQLLRQLVVGIDLPKSRGRYLTFGPMAAALYERDLLPTALYVELEHLVTARNLLAHGGTSHMSAEDFRSLEATARRFFKWHFVESGSGPRMSASAADALLTVPVLSDDPAARSRRRVFICYATEDRRAADELYDRLQARGHEPWMDKRSLLPGQNWETEIESAIRGADAFIACLSTKSISKRGFLQKEIRHALDVLGLLPPGQIYLIPLLIEPCSPPPHLQSLHWLDWTAPGAEVQLYRAIEHHGNG